MFICTVHIIVCCNICVTFCNILFSFFFTILWLQWHVFMWSIDKLWYLRAYGETSQLLKLVQGCNAWRARVMAKWHRCIDHMDKMKRIKRLFIKLPGFQLWQNLLRRFCMRRIFLVRFPRTFRRSIWPHQFHSCSVLLFMIN